MPLAYYPPPSTDPTKQPLDPTLTAFAGLPGGSDRLPYFTGVDSLAQATITAYARTLLDDAAATNARSTLGLGTIATQNAHAVSISGGDLTNVDVLFQGATTGQPSFRFNGGTIPSNPQNGWLWFSGGVIYYRTSTQTLRINTTVV